MCFLFYFFSFFFFFNDTATTEIYTLSLHDALPICRPRGRRRRRTGRDHRARPAPRTTRTRVGRRRRHPTRGPSVGAATAGQSRLGGSATGGRRAVPVGGLALRRRSPVAAPVGVAAQHRAGVGRARAPHGGV